jgi:hypothetical protein
MASTRPTSVCNFRLAYTHGCSHLSNENIVDSISTRAIRESERSCMLQEALRHDERSWQGLGELAGGVGHSNNGYGVSSVSCVST